MSKPSIPVHPEPMAMKWSELELRAIEAYGEQMAAHARKQYIEAIRAEVAHYGQSTEWAAGIRRGLEMAMDEIESME